MLIGAAIVPTAPLLVQGVSRWVPHGVDATCDAVRAVVDGLAHADVAVLVAAGGHHEPTGVYEAGIAGLAGVGRPDIAERPAMAGDATTAIAGRTGQPLVRAPTLPLGLSVLCLLLAPRRPVAAIAVSRHASFEALTAVGAGIADALAGPDLRAVVVAAGDCSAGLGPASPLTHVEGARSWDDHVADAVDSGRLDGLRRLGPAEAARVGAWGWAPMCVLHGACAKARLGMAVRHYSAPAGVGYLVARGG